MVTVTLSTFMCIEWGVKFTHTSSLTEGLNDYCMHVFLEPLQIVYLKKI